MPVIALFFGIVIRMFYDDHLPPHIHAQYQEHEALIDFSGTILKGKLPHRQKILVEAWILLHEPELRENWEAAQSHQTLTSIRGLK